LLADGELLAYGFSALLEPFVEVHFSYLPNRHARISTQTLREMVWNVEFAKRLKGRVSKGVWGENNRGKDVLCQTSLDVFNGQTARARVFRINNVKKM
jgi:hypothetical protein